MAGTESQKQLLSLIRDFAAEKSHGERRVSNLKKRIEELRSEFDTANSNLENQKRVKEDSEQEIKGYEVELSMTETSIKTLEARICSIQDEISKVGNDVDSLKMKEAAQRDEFIQQMLDLKMDIRKFQDYAFHILKQNCCSETQSDHNQTVGGDSEIAGLEETVSVIVAQTATEEHELEREKNIHSQLHQELADSKKRLELTEAIIKDMKELQDLMKQTSGLEEKCGSVSEDLQRKCICPSCCRDNSEVLAELLQEMEHH